MYYQEIESDKEQMDLYVARQKKLASERLANNQKWNKANKPSKTSKSGK